MRRKTPKIQDVAKVAGVSTATVSRALSNPGILAKETRDAVNEAIRATGYRVNQTARNLRKQRAGAVMILVPNLGNPFFSQILAGLSEVLSGSEYSVLITDSSERRQKGKLLEYFQDARVDGMVSLDGNMSEVELARFGQGAAGTPIVFACEWVHGAPYASVRSNNIEGARLAVRHLYDLGHRDIAHITGPKGNVLTHARREGMLQERERLGLSVQDDWIIRGDFSLRSGYEAASKVAGMSRRPTAVFCASDQVACGLVSGLKEFGLSVPKDVSVVGFDDIEIAAYFDPSLTTIRQDRHQLGTKAANLILNQLANPNIQDTQNIEYVEVELVARESSVTRL